MNEFRTELFALKKRIGAISQKSIYFQEVKIRAIFSSNHNV